MLVREQARLLERGSIKLLGHQFVCFGSSCCMGISKGEKFLAGQLSLFLTASKSRSHNKGREGPTIEHMNISYEVFFVIVEALFSMGQLSQKTEHWLCYPSSLSGYKKVHHHQVDMNLHPRINTN